MLGICDTHVRVCAYTYTCLIVCLSTCVCVCVFLVVAVFRPFFLPRSLSRDGGVVVIVVFVAIVVLGSARCGVPGVVVVVVLSWCYVAGRLEVFHPWSLASGPSRLALGPLGLSFLRPSSRDYSGVARSSWLFVLAFMVVCWSFVFAFVAVLWEWFGLRPPGPLVSLGGRGIPWLSLCPSSLCFSLLSRLPSSVAYRTNGFMASRQCWRCVPQIAAAPGIGLA